MFETLVVATDGSKAAEKAVVWAVELAKTHSSRLIVLNVTPDQRVKLAQQEPDAPPAGDVSYFDAGDLVSDEALARAEKLAKEAGLTYELQEVYGRNIAATIAKTAQEDGADHIVIGSTGVTALATCVLGSVAQNVVHYAHCPVTVVR